MTTIMVLSNGMKLTRRDPDDRPSTPPADIKVGPYWTKDGRPARVRKAATSERLYALGMNVETGKYEYEKGLIYNLGERMTLESAREWGARYKRCANCGKSLTDNKSVDEGMGPVCRKRIGG